jgi:RNA polymerase sporulation-specific sigma factor
MTGGDEHAAAAVLAMSARSDEQLAARVRIAGDEQAFDRLADRHDDLIRYHARRYFRDGYDGDDMRQEALVGLLKACRTYRPDRRTSFRTHASRCIRQRLWTLIERVDGPKERAGRDHVHYQASPELMRVLAHPLTTERIVEAREDLRALARELPAHLTPRERAALRRGVLDCLDERTLQTASDLIDHGWKPVDKQARRRRGLELLAGGRTQSEVAAELGVRQTTVSYWARKAAA